MAIKDEIKKYLATLPDGNRIKATTIWREVFRYQVAQGSITRALRHLANEGIVKRSSLKGKNSDWIILGGKSG